LSFTYRWRKSKLTFGLMLIGSFVNLKKSLGKNSQYDSASHKEGTLNWCQTRNRVWKKYGSCLYALPRSPCHGEACPVTLDIIVPQWCPGSKKLLAAPLATAELLFRRDKSWHLGKKIWTFPNSRHDMARTVSPDAHPHAHCYEFFPHWHAKLRAMTYVNRLSCQSQISFIRVNANSLARFSHDSGSYFTFGLVIRWDFRLVLNSDWYQISAKNWSRFSFGLSESLSDSLKPNVGLSDRWIQSYCN